MTELPTIQHKTFIAAPATRVYEVLTTAAGWDSWFTCGASIEARNGGELLTDGAYGPDALGVVGPTGAITGASPYAMCATGWGEALTLLKMFIERGISYGPVPAEASA
jgi:hypothetical protein